MHDLLDPTLDIVFKLLFTRDHPDSREALLGLVTAVVRPASPLTSVEVLNPEVGRAAVDDKSVVLDIRARLADGTTTNVEMQARNVPPFRTRLLYYWAGAFTQPLKGCRQIAWGRGPNAASGAPIWLCQAGRGAEPLEDR